MTAMRKALNTTAGQISIVESQGTGPSVFFIHGNSFSSKLFQEQLNGAFGKTYHAVAIDLPGHGESDNAINPERDYSLAGYSLVIEEVIDQLGLGSTILVGTSLGGHIALELMERIKSKVMGVVAAAAPPVGPNPTDLGKAFIPSQALECIFKGTLSSEEIHNYVQAVKGNSGGMTYKEALDDVERTDGRARSLLGASLQRGELLDEVRIVSESRIPLLMMGGGDDPLINWDYVRNLDYENLFRDEIQIIPGVGHLMLQNQPLGFESLITDFIEDLI